MLLDPMTTIILHHQSPKFPRPPVCPLQPPNVVAADEQRCTALLISALVSQALHARTLEGQASALTEPSLLHSVAEDACRREVRKLFGSWLLARIYAVRQLSSTRTSLLTLRLKVASGTLKAPERYNDSHRAEIRRGLENDRARSSKRRRYRRIRFYEEAYPDISGVDPSHAERHINLVELSPQSVISANWTAAARDAHTRRNPEPANRPQHSAEASLG